MFQTKFWLLILFLLPDMADKDCCPDDGCSVTGQIVCTILLLMYWKEKMPSNLTKSIISVFDVNKPQFKHNGSYTL